MEDIDRRLLLILAHGERFATVARLARRYRSLALNVSPCLISPVSNPFLNHRTRCSEVPWVKESGAHILALVAAAGRRRSNSRRAALRRYRRDRARAFAAACNAPTRLPESRPAIPAAPKARSIPFRLRAAQRIDLVAGSQQLLNVMPHLVSNHIRLRKIPWGMKTPLQFVEETQIEINFLIFRAIKRPDGSTGKTTFGISATGEERSLGALYAIPVL